MPSIYDKLLNKGLLPTPPSFIKNNIHYEVIMGSFAYGINDDLSDVDVYGFCIPPKPIIFPHLDGEIIGFGTQHKKFGQYQQHHILDKDNNREYDLTIFNIVQFFNLIFNNNPNMIDLLFVPQRCIVHITQIGNYVRENRKLFLSKHCFQKFKGYAYSQIHKMRTKKPIGKRKEIIEKHSFDTKFAYHTIRLLNECEQILVEHDLDLERNREQLKAIRSGEWTQNQIIDYFNKKEKDLESLYVNSSLRYSPDEEKIKKILLECLEMHYGSLDKVIKTEKSIDMFVNDLQDLINKYKKGTE